MEVKPWNEYSVSEKKILLNFWFGNINRNRDMVTKEDREQFKSLLEKDIDLIMDYVVTLTILDQNSGTMISAMRNGTLERALDTLPRMGEDADYQSIKRQVITILVGLCNITMTTTDTQEIIESAVQLTAETVSVETAKEIKKYFS